MTRQNFPPHVAREEIIVPAEDASNEHVTAGGVPVGVGER